MSRPRIASRRLIFILSTTAALAIALTAGAASGRAATHNTRLSSPDVECSPSTCGGGGGGCQTATREEREACGYNFFRTYGLTRAQAAGLVGNLSVESAGVCSGMDPTCWEGGCSDHSFYDSECGYGIAQWTYYTRKEGLLTYAGSLSNAQQLIYQLGYVWQELTTTYQSALNNLENVTGDSQSAVYQASDVVMYDYENPAVLGQDARRDRSWTIFNNNPY